MFETILYLPLTEDKRADGSSIPGTGASKPIGKCDTLGKVLDWMGTMQGCNNKYLDDAGLGFCYTFRLSGFKFLELKMVNYQGDYVSEYARGEELAELSKRVFDVEHYTIPKRDDVDEYLFKIVKYHMIEKYIRFLGKPNQLIEELGYGSRVLIKCMGVDFALVHMIPDETGQIDFHFQKLDMCQHQWEAQLDWDRTNEMTYDPNRTKVPTGKYFCRNCGEERVREPDPTDTVINEPPF